MGYNLLQHISRYFTCCIQVLQSTTFHDLNRVLREQCSCKHCRRRLKMRLRYEVLLRNWSFLWNAFPLQVRMWFFWLFSPDCGALLMMLDECKTLILLTYRNKAKLRKHISYSLRCPLGAENPFLFFFFFLLSILWMISWRPSTHTRKPSITYHASYLWTIWKQS